MDKREERIGISRALFSLLFRFESQHKKSAFVFMYAFLFACPVVCVCVCVWEKSDDFGRVHLLFCPLLPVFPSQVQTISAVPSR